VYPDMRVYPGGPPKRPYDITGWTLSYQMGVRADRVAEAVDVATEKVDVATMPPGMVPAGIAGQPYYFAIDPRANDAFIAVNRLLKEGVPVYRATQAIAAGGAEFPPGAFLAPPTASTRALSDAARSLGLTVAVGPTEASAPPRVRLRAPRIGLYHGWGGNMDEGWTRWLLEQFEFPYTSVFDRDVRAGNLRAKFDVILLPDATYDQMLNGMAPGSMPDAYTGGMTVRGVSNLYEFVTQGGTLVAMDRAAELPLTTFGLPVRNVTAGVLETDSYIPGSILRIAVDPTHPVAYGMPPDAAAFFINSPAFAIGRRTSQFDDSPAVEPPVPQGLHVVAHYPESNLLMSGWMLGERLIARRAAVIEAAVDKGPVVLLG